MVQTSNLNELEENKYSFQPRETQRLKNETFHFELKFKWRFKQNNWLFIFLVRDSKWPYQVFDEKLPKVNVNERRRPTRDRTWI